MKEFEIDPSLIRKILFPTSSTNEKKINPDALEVVGELVRQFIIETRHRASIEVRFDFFLLLLFRFIWIYE
jgi:hypothetical protein